MILFGIILFFAIVAYVLAKTEVPVYLDKDNKPITTQDGLEDVIKEETTQDIVEKNNLELEKKLLNVDFVEKPKEEFKDTVGGRQLTEHINEVIELNPASKKRLTKRQRNTVDKIAKEKK